MQRQYYWTSHDSEHHTVCCYEVGGCARQEGTNRLKFDPRKRIAGTNLSLIHISEPTRPRLI
eukprot:3011033-Rhodomonas_salina.1